MDTLFASHTAIFFYCNYFQKKLLLQTESCTMESVEVYSQSSLIPTFMYVYKESDIFVT